MPSGWYKKAPLRKRFNEKYEISISGCWNWTGSVDSKGYGSIKDGVTSRAHRVAWKLYKGKIPEGIFVLHTCDNRKCVNPNHLFLGTSKDNVRDMMDKGRHPNCVEKIKTHCIHGHEFTKENTYIFRGHRECKMCGRIRGREFATKMRRLNGRPIRKF